MASVHNQVLAPTQMYYCTQDPTLGQRSQQGARHNIVPVVAAAACLLVLGVTTLSSSSSSTQLVTVPRYVLVTTTPRTPTYLQYRHALTVWFAGFHKELCRPQQCRVCLPLHLRKESPDAGICLSSRSLFPFCMNVPPSNRSRDGIPSTSRCYRECP